MADSGTPTSDPTRIERKRLTRNRREGFLLSIIFHLLVTLFLVLEPKFLSSESRPEENPLAPKPDRLVLFMDQPQPGPNLVPVVPVPNPSPVPPEPPRARLVIPKATRPAPPDKQQQFQNDLPFSEGNTDEFVTDKPNKEPGKEGNPGEPKPESSVEEDNPQKPSGSGTEEQGQTLAETLSKDRLFYPGATPESGGSAARPRGVPPPSPQPGKGGEGGDRGQGGTFEDIRRFLQDKRFHNPEGGLVTGLGSTLYYDDKGADFVPWLRRMLAEVRRNFMMPYSASFLAGHVAVGVAVSRVGDIVELKIVLPSGISGFDNAAVGSLRAADLLPLPSSYPDDRFDFILVFWINEKPYELF